MNEQQADELIGELRCLRESFEKFANERSRRGMMAAMAVLGEHLKQFIPDEWVEIEGTNGKGKRNIGVRKRLVEAQKILDEVVKVWL